MPEMDGSPIVEMYEAWGLGKEMEGVGKCELEGCGVPELESPVSVEMNRGELKDDVDAAELDSVQSRENG